MGRVTTNLGGAKVECVRHILSNSCSGCGGVSADGVVSDDV